MTFLQLINKVMVRLRQTQISIVDQDQYTTLIGVFVNEGKRKVESAWEWDVNNVSLPLTTIAGTSKYTVTGSGLRQRSVTINNTTDKAKLRPASKNWILD